jgi:hypothetical protein
MAKNISGLKPFKAGEDSRRNLEGRPRKYVSLLKEQGYKLNEINDSIQALMSMTPKELEAITNKKHYFKNQKFIFYAKFTYYY